MTEHVPQSKGSPPAAPRRIVTTNQLGRVRSDPYDWLKDPNWREVMREPARLDAEIRRYLEAENAWTHDRLEAPTAALQEALFGEMKGRIKEDDSSAPQPDGPWAYYRRFRSGGEYPLYVRRPRERAFDGDPSCEELLLDGDALAAGCDYLDIRRVHHSPDHRLIAYTIDDKGSEFYTLRIRDLATGLDLPSRIEGTYGEFVWDEAIGASGQHALFWIERDANARPVAVHRRLLADDSDELIYRESDPRFFLGLHRSLSRRFVFISANDHATSEWRLIPAGTSPGEAAPRLIAARERNVEYTVNDFDGQLLIRTNAGGAVDFKLAQAPVDAPGRENWRDLIAHRPGVLLLDTVAFAEHLVRLERENGLPRIVVRERGSGAEHSIAFEEAAYALGVHSGFEHAASTLRFEYSSPTTPAQVFDYDMAVRTRQMRKQQEVPSGHDASAYIVERIDAPAADGALIPVTVLRRRDTPCDGTAPLLLYGYGAYGITIPSDFRTARLSLVDRGFVYAVADVRGSMAKGYQWYLDGKLEKKANTFADFVAAGRRLADLGYSAPGRIVAMGGSAGGMLMGAAVNLDPELFAGVIAAVPFVDVLNTMSDASLPLTPPEWPEWGDPTASEADYDRILSWSPYDQVADRPYPPILATGGLTDPRVTYWEPAKWIAKLRHDAPRGGPYYLRINMDAGHGGVSGRFASLRETALELAFAIEAAAGRLR